jgi:hypothetical protein
VRTNNFLKSGNLQTDPNRRLAALERIVGQIPSRYPTAAPAAGQTNTIAAFGATSYVYTVPNDVKHITIKAVSAGGAAGPSSGGILGSGGGSGALLIVDTDTDVLGGNLVITLFTDSMTIKLEGDTDSVSLSISNGGAGGVTVGIGAGPFLPGAGGNLTSSTSFSAVPMLVIPGSNGSGPLYSGRTYVEAAAYLTLTPINVLSDINFQPGQPAPGFYLESGSYCGQGGFYFVEGDLELPGPQGFVILTD